MHRTLICMFVCANTCFKKSSTEYIYKIFIEFIIISTCFSKLQNKDKPEAFDYYKRNAILMIRYQIKRHVYQYLKIVFVL